MPPPPRKPRPADFTISHRAERAGGPALPRGRTDRSRAPRTRSAAGLGPPECGHAAPPAPEGRAERLPRVPSPPAGSNTPGSPAAVSAPGIFHSKGKKAETEVPFTEAQTFKALYLTYLHDTCLRSAPIPSELFRYASSPFHTVPRPNASHSGRTAPCLPKHHRLRST